MEAAMSAYPPGSEARPLPDCHEARGQLLSVFCRNGFAVATFAWGAISLPDELEGGLRELVGHEIAILRLDGRCHVREV
jgi:hypothetical protein